MQPRINVLVVEDSPSVRQLLVHLLDATGRIQVIGTAEDGEQALEFLQTRKPDVVIMDVHMPRLDGYQATRRIMETQPVPIIVCSASLSPEDVTNTFRALDAGAVALVAKPVGPGHPDFPSITARLVQTVIAMSEVKVVRRWPRRPRAGAAETRSLRPARPPRPAGSVEVVAIGTSTGGPPVLQTILTGLPVDFPAPVLIVQHIVAGFLPGLVQWLSETSGFPTRIATHGEAMRPGQAYLAPDGYHMGADGQGRIALSRAAPENGLRPAVSYLFRSVATHHGARAVAVLLTGMGRDGAEELKQLRDLGATTLAQDRESSVVNGMPGEAISLGGATYVLPPDRIPMMLNTLVTSTAAVDGRSGNPPSISSWKQPL